MSDALYELLEPHLDASSDVPDASSSLTSGYIHRITTLSLSSLRGTEPEALKHDSQSLLRSIQALSKRSYKSIDLSIDALSTLRENIPQITQNATDLQAALPSLESNAVSFAEKYSKLTDNAVLDRRKRILRLGDNVDRLADILEMPALLSGTIAASTGMASGTTTGTSATNASYTSALDLYAHIRRLQKLYPDSGLVQSILLQSDEAMRTMTTNLITSLRSQSLKLAGAMRLIGLLRRVTPELDDILNPGKAWTSGMGEGSLGVIFLVCRLSTLTTTLEALEPLRELADQELGQSNKVKDKSAWAAGQQTERYLKRYVEVFREQCFSIISMYKSIFPTSLPVPNAGGPASDEFNASARPSNVRSASGLRDADVELPDDPMQHLPVALSTFSLHIVDLLMDTLKKYMPNIRDQSSRDSLLTQVLYCAASLGRLGGDFSMMLSMLSDELDATTEPKDADPLATNQPHSEPEWVQVMRKHRVQAGRLETLASGAGRQASK